MRVRRRFLSGDAVTVDVPDAQSLADGVAVGVLDVDRFELELSAGPAHALEFFLTATGSKLSSSFLLRSGLELRCGAFGGDPAAGLAFAVAAGTGHLFGYAAPAFGPDRLAAHLTDVGVDVTDGAGPTVSPTGTLRWSRTRPQAVAQVIDLSPGNGYLLDVRQARPAAASALARGAKVRGGMLSRSSPQQNRPHVVLESERFVAYGLPTPGTPLDAVVASMAEVSTT